MYVSYSECFGTNKKVTVVLGNMHKPVHRYCSMKLCQKMEFQPSTQQHSVMLHDIAEVPLILDISLLVSVLLYCWENNCG